MAETTATRRRKAAAKPPWPLCNFVLRDGTPCMRTSLERSGGPCAGHARKADDAAVLPFPATAGTPEPDVAEQGSSENPRRRLARDAARGYEAIRGAVFDGLQAERAVPVRCPECNHRFQASVPDHGARLKSVELALREGYGRPGEDDDQAGSLSLDQLTDAIAQFYDDHPGVPRTGGPFGELPAGALDVLTAFLYEHPVPADDEHEVVRRVRAQKRLAEEVV